MVDDEAATDSRAPLSRELLKKLRKIEIVTRRKVNDQLAGQYHSVFKGRGMSFDEVRQYEPGDEIRFIDWNVTARSHDVYVKRFVEERELTVLLAVDVSASLRFGSVAQVKRDVAAELTALLAFSAIKNNDRVGLVLFSDHIERFVPPKKGRKHVMRLITEILHYQPTSTRTDLGDALGYLSKILRRRATVFVLSDFQAPRGSFDKPLRVVARRHDLVPIVIRDAMEDELPDLGLTLVEDLETGETRWLDTASAKVRRRYREDAARAHAHLMQRFRRLRVDAIDIRTGGSYVSALVQFFQLRARRQ